MVVYGIPLFCDSVRLFNPCSCIRKLTFSKKFTSKNASFRVNTITSKTLGQEKNYDKSENNVDKTREGVYYD